MQSGAFFLGFDVLLCNYSYFSNEMGIQNAFSSKENRKDGNRTTTLAIITTTRSHEQVTN
jgi:hypothetical protein